jgi:hypothetical protein
MCHTFFTPDFAERRNLELLESQAGPGDYLNANPNPIPCLQGDPQTWRALFYVRTLHL